MTGKRMSDHEDLLREHGELKAQVTRLKMELAVAHRERDSARADALEEAAVAAEHACIGIKNGVAINACRAVARTIRTLKHIQPCTPSAPSSKVNNDTQP